MLSYDASYVRVPRPTHQEHKPTQAEERGISWRYFDVASDEVAIRGAIDDIELNLGPIHALVYNLGANMGIRPVLPAPAMAEAACPTDKATFEKMMHRGAYGGLVAAQCAARYMATRKCGFIGFTGATASLRGAEGHTLHVTAMFARRV